MQSAVGENGGDESQGKADSGQGNEGRGGRGRSWLGTMSHEARDTVGRSLLRAGGCGE